MSEFTQLDNALMSMSDAAFTAAVMQGDAAGERRRGAAMAALLMAAAFVSKPNDLNGSEPYSDEIIDTITAIANSHGPRGLYELIAVLGQVTIETLETGDRMKQNQEVPEPSVI